MKQHATDIEPITLAEHSWFFVGAEYVEVDGRTLTQGGMYVEMFVPQEQNMSTPVVMIHGGAQTGTNFIATPDGRRGWLHDFLRAGYAVFVVDQPERGRSGHSHQSLQSERLALYEVEKIEDNFTAPGKKRLWPQARHHCQWPGTGEKGDPAFDQFYASQVEALSNRTEIERLNQAAGIALLERIGPAILLTHSQSGPFGWLIADAMPTHVKAILALEPNGPPFFDVQFTGQEDWYVHAKRESARPNGITRLPLGYEPPLNNAETLAFEEQPPEPEQELVTGFLQTQPARQLPNLQGIPIAILVAQASYHAAYDHLTSAFLSQAGVQHDFLRLEEYGFEGNGHMVMLEENNHLVADFMIDWLKKNCQ